MLYLNHMKTRIFFIVIGAIILIGVGVAMFTNKGVNFGGSNDDGSSIEPKTVFAQCLKDKGVVFYGAFWCPHCQAQKKLFGKKAFEALKSVECSTADGKNQTQECKDAGITGYPTWKFADGSVQTGELTFAQLAEKTSCAAPIE